MNDDDSASNDETKAKPSGVRVSAAKCVRCGKPVQARYRPFCSQRCMDADLGAWLGGSYRVETDEQPDGSSADEDSEPY